MDEATLGERLGYWQQRLRLSDWKIQGKIVRGNEMDNSDWDGCCTVQRTRMRATIQLIDPTDYPKDGYWPQDMEVTLVHELLHIHAEGLGVKDGSPEQMTVEKMIHQLSEVLVELDREVRRSENDAGS